MVMYDLPYISSFRPSIPEEAQPKVKAFVDKLEEYLPEEYVQELQGNDNPLSC